MFSWKLISDIGIMNFVAETSIYNVMLEYLHPFELAVVTGAHTHASYLNAATQGSTEYLTRYKSISIDINWALYAAAATGQLESINVLATLGATNFDLALYDAAKAGQCESIKLLVKLGATQLDHAIGDAVSARKFKSIRLLIRLGAQNYECILENAIKNDDHPIIKLLVRPSIDLNSALCTAVECGNLRLISLLIIRYGVNDFDTTIEYANDINQPKAAALLQKLRVQFE